MRKKIDIKAEIEAGIRLEKEREWEKMYRFFTGEWNTLMVLQWKNKDKPKWYEILELEYEWVDLKSSKVWFRLKNIYFPHFED